MVLRAAQLLLLLADAGVALGTEALKTIVSKGAWTPTVQRKRSEPPSVSPYSDNASSHPQERIPTPPPSPFASYFQGPELGDEEEEAAPLEDHRLDAKPVVPGGFRQGGCFETADQLRAVPVLGKGGSLSLPPDTPSAVSEAQLAASSRIGSVISDPTLAELLQAKLAHAGKCTLARK